MVNMLSREDAKNAYLGFIEAFVQSRYYGDSTTYIHGMIQGAGTILGMRGSDIEYDIKQAVKRGPRFLSANKNAHSGNQPE